MYPQSMFLSIIRTIRKRGSRGSEVAEWLAHWLLVLEVLGSIPAGGEDLLVRTCFPSCHDSVRRPSD